MREGRGWIALQSWFEVQIEPWIDRTIARHDPKLRSQWQTINRMTLEKRSLSPLNPVSPNQPTNQQRKVLKTMGARGRTTPPPKLAQQ